MKKIVLMTGTLMCLFFLAGCMGINQNPQSGAVTSQTGKDSTVVDPSGVKSTVNQQVNPSSVATPTTPNNQTPAQKDPAAVPVGVDLNQEISCYGSKGMLSRASDGYAHCVLAADEAVYFFEYKEDKCSITLGSGGIVSNGKISCKYDKQAQILEASDSFSNCRIDIANKKIIYNSPISSCEIDIVNNVVNKTVK